MCNNINTFKDIIYMSLKPYYIQNIQLDLGSVRPHISGPNHVKSMTSINDAESKKIKDHKAHIKKNVNCFLYDT